MKERNRQVKDYFHTYFCDEPPYIKKALKNSLDKGLKPIHISPHTAKMIYSIGKLIAPKKILEIGSLGGYSALWLANTLTEGGKLISLEIEPLHVEVSRKNITDAGKEDLIEIREGDALESLNEMIAKNESPFDLIFLDAAKGSYPEYLEKILALSRPGTTILCDNLIPKRGELGMPDPRDKEAIAVLTFNQMLIDHPQLETVPLATFVGDEGSLDALGLSRVNYV